jgi:hypothetical protein
MRRSMMAYERLRSRVCRFAFLGAFFALAFLTLSTTALAGCKFSVGFVGKASRVATPSFSPAGGTYSSDQSVTIRCATPGSTVHYTIDGSSPTSSSAVYNGPISVSGTGTIETIQAAAIKSGLDDSDTTSATYAINNPNQVSTPSFSPAGGTYSSDQTVSINCATAGATVYYTMDGTTPTASSTQYSDPISVSGDGTTKTIKAIAVKAGLTTSAVASASYVIDYSALTAATPTFSPAGGTYTGSQTVTLSCATSGATIHYTTDGTTPTSTSTIYVGAIAVSSSETIEAIATKTGYSNSAVASATYTIIGGAYTLSLDLTTLTLGAGVTRTITATVTPATTQYISWTSSNTAVATVMMNATNTATITAVSAGTAVITASMTTMTSPSSTFTATCALTVAAAGTLSSTKSFSSFCFKGYEGYPGTVTNNSETSGAVTVTLPTDVDVSKLVAVFVSTGQSVTVGSTAQVSGVTANDFTSSVSYTVAAADGSARVYAVSASSSKSVAVIAGSPGNQGSTDGTGTGSSSTARFTSPGAITSDGTNLYVLDNDTVRKVVIATGETTTIAGTAGATGSADGTGSAASFSNPSAIATDGTNLYVTANYAIRKVVISTGETTTIAGVSGSSGSIDGTGTAARFSDLSGIVSDSTNLYIMDSGNHTIRRIVVATGVVSVFVGSTGSTSSFDGVGIEAGFEYPHGLTSDGTNLYVIDSYRAIRKIVIATAKVSSQSLSPASQSSPNMNAFSTDGTKFYYLPSNVLGTAISSNGQILGSMVLATTTTVSSVWYSDGFSSSASISGLCYAGGHLYCSFGYEVGMLF